VYEYTVVYARRCGLVPKYMYITGLFRRSKCFLSRQLRVTAIFSGGVPSFRPFPVFDFDNHFNTDMWINCAAVNHGRTTVNIERTCPAVSYMHRYIHSSEISPVLTFLLQRLSSHLHY
jgi:hypothetical protein